jgi:hypothetical protein
MTAEWNLQAIAAMSPKENLRNTCQQIEQEYVDWRRAATYRGCCGSRQWPAIGELGRWTVGGVVIEFVTTGKRSIAVQDSTGCVRADVPMKAGMAQTLYDIAVVIAQEFLASAPWQQP